MAKRRKNYEDAGMKPAWLLRKDGTPYEYGSSALKKGTSSAELTCETTKQTMLLFERCLKNVSVKKNGSKQFWQTFLGMVLVVLRDVCVLAQKRQIFCMQRLILGFPGPKLWQHSCLGRGPRYDAPSGENVSQCLAVKHVNQNNRVPTFGFFDGPDSCDPISSSSFWIQTIPIKFIHSIYLVFFVILDTFVLSWVVSKRSTGICHGIVLFSGLQHCNKACTPASWHVHAMA